MNNEQYRGQIPVEELQRDYFNHFNYTYWMHKANALINYIDNPSTIDKLKFKGDKDSEETILNNLKMELHMIVFHCSETLFLNIFSIVFAPTLPWIWISRCEPSKLHDLIRLVSEKGLSTLHQSPMDLLRENLFSEVREGHQNYEKSKASSLFVTKYIETLAREYLDHNEYNSYKHGLRGFVGRSKFQAFDDTTSEKICDMESDTIQFWNLKRKTIMENLMYYLN